MYNNNIIINNNSSSNSNNNVTCSIIDVFKKTVLKTEVDFYLSEENGSNSGFSSSSSGSNFSNGRLESPRNSRNLLSMNNNNSISNGTLSPRLHLNLNTGENVNNSTINNINNINNNSSTNVSNFQPIKVMINNCRKSNIYILVTIALSTINSCHDCTIVLGPCCDYIEISDCSSLTIIALTKGIRIKSSTNINVNICTNQKPIISSDCSNIKLAPYNTHYPTLESQIAQSKIQTNLSSNLWNCPLVFNTLGSDSSSTAATTSTTTDSLLTNHETTTDLSTGIKNINLNYSDQNNNTSSNIYSIVDPDDFYPFSVPFVLKGKTKTNPCELPTKYTKSLIHKTSSIQSLHKMIQQSTPDQKIRGHIMHLVESKFQDWLIETDNIRQINDLINMKK